MDMHPVPKLYYVANARMPSDRAYGIQLAKMCEALVEAGIDLELIIPRKKAAVENLAAFYGLRRGIPVRRLPVPFFFSRTRFGFNAAAAIFSFEATMLLFLRRIASRTPFIIYTIDLDQFSFYPLVLLGVPLFMEFHSTKKKSALYWSLVKRMKGAIVINGRIAEDFIFSFGVPREKIVIATNGSDPLVFENAISRNEARKRLGIPEHARMVLHTGRFYPWKGLEILLHAARLLPEIHFYIVGGTVEELRDVCGRHVAVPPNVVCAGYRPYEEMPLWITAGDALLTLGTKGNEYSYRDTSPMKLFEYLASGRPIIASRTPANIEIVTDREALFYEPDSAESLKKAILEVFRDEGAAHVRALRAKEKAKEYSWSNRAKRVVQFIQNQQ